MKDKKEKAARVAFHGIRALFNFGLIFLEFGVG